MNTEQLTQRIAADLRLMPTAAERHAAALQLKAFADLLIDAQQMDVPVRLRYWSACTAVYMYLYRNRCLQRRRNPLDTEHHLGVYQAIDHAERRASHVDQ